jgi:hypothetical protein
MMKKWGGLIYDNPGIAERLRQGWYLPANLGIEKDEFGNKIDSEGNYWHAEKGPDGKITYRKLNKATESALIGKRTGIALPIGWIPKSLRGSFGDEAFVDMSSLNILFQGDPPYLPGLGPLAQIPANEIVKRAFSDSASNPIISYLLPYGTTNDNVAEQLLPAWAKYAIHSGATPFGTDEEWRKQAAIQFRENYIKWEQGGRKGPAPTVDQVANQVKNWFLMRAMVGTVSPVSIQPSQDMKFWIDQAHVYQQKYGNVQQDPQYKTLLKQYTDQYGQDGKDRLLYDHPEYQGWLERFRQDFPEYFDLAVSVSSNESGLVATAKAESLRKKYAKEIRASDGQYADVIAGPDNTYGLTPDTQYSDIAHDAQLSTETSPGSGKTLRSYDDPKTALATAEAQKGWADYQANRTKLNVWLEQNGYSSLRSAPDSIRAPGTSTSRTLAIRTSSGGRTSKRRTRASPSTCSRPWPRPWLATRSWRVSSTCRPLRPTCRPAPGPGSNWPVGAERSTRRPMPTLPTPSMGTFSSSCSGARASSRSTTGTSRTTSSSSTYSKGVDDGRRSGI